MNRKNIWEYTKNLYKDYNNIYVKKYSVSVQKSIKVVKDDSLDFPINNNLENTVILLFADDITPGGCIESCNGMQEESLFRRSALFRYLDKSLYPIKDNEAIYCRNVPVYRMSENYNDLIINERYFSFIACPCIKFPGMMLQDKEYNLLKTKIRLIFDIAINNNHDNIILGAWGCGVYGNSSKDISKIFKEVIKENEYDKNINIYFCILGKAFYDFDDTFKNEDYF